MFDVTEFATEIGHLSHNAGSEKAGALQTNEALNTIKTFGYAKSSFLTV